MPNRYFCQAAEFFATRGFYRSPMNRTQSFRQAIQRCAVLGRLCHKRMTRYSNSATKHTSTWARMRLDTRRLCCPLSLLLHCLPSAIKFSIAVLRCRVRRATTSERSATTRRRSCHFVSAHRPCPPVWGLNSPHGAVKSRQRNSATASTYCSEYPCLHCAALSPTA